jgi:glycosyltransferase involved in cell wall biosynthesis
LESSAESWKIKNSKIVLKTPRTPQTLITIIIPVFNEEKTVGRVLDEVDRLSLEKQVIVVDDGSTDGTTKILSSHPARRRMEIFLLPNNLGKGGAIHHALPHARGEIVVIQDADLEYPPSEIPNLIQPILEEKADAVFGARFKDRSNFSWHRLGNRMITTWFNLLARSRFTDMETGAKAMRTFLIQQMPLTSNRFGFEPEVTARLLRRKARIQEIPYTGYSARSHADGKKLTFKDGLAALWHSVKYNLSE